jgi:hypothetical protein
MRYTSLGAVFFLEEIMADRHNEFSQKKNKWNDHAIKRRVNRFHSLSSIVERIMTIGHQLS